VYLHSQQWVGAVVEAKRSQALGVTDPLAAAAIGLAYVELGEFTRARPWLERVGERVQGNARLLLALGKCLRAAEAWDEAYEAFSSAVRLAPTSADAAYELGVTCVVLGQLEAAEAELRRACQLDPASTEAYFELGCILLNHRKCYAEALLCNQMALQASPGHFGAAVNAAAALMNLNRSREAEPLLRRAIRSIPREAVAWRLMGDVQLLAGRREQALDVFERALHIGPPDERVLLALRDASEKVGDRAALLRRLTRLLKIHRRWPLLHAVAGMTLHDLNHYDKADAAYGRARRLGLHEPWLYLSHSRLLCKAGRPHDAARLLRRSLVRWPDNLELAYHLGLTYVGQQRPVEAQRIFARISRRDPNHAEAAYLAGDLLMQRGRKFYRRAAAYFLHTINLAPNHTDALWNLAAIHHCWRRIPQARHYLARAEAAGARDPRLPQFKRALGLA
jgi:tetratricopeptide (TPR) repeat protein